MKKDLWLVIIQGIVSIALFISGFWIIYKEANWNLVLGLFMVIWGQNITNKMKYKSIDDED